MAVITLIVSSIVLGCVYGLIGLSYSLTYKASGLMSFVQGDLLTWGAFLGITFYDVLKLPYLAAVLCTAAVMFLMGYLIQKGIIRTLVSKNITPLYVVLALIAFSYVLQNGAQIIWGTVPLYFSSIMDGTINLMGLSVQPESILCIGASFLIMLALHFFMTRTKLGTAMRAASMDSLAAESVGIDVSLTNGLVWGLSAALVAMAGILCGPVYGVVITLGANLGRKGFSGAVIGGYGNMYGAMIGGILLGFIETFVSSYVSSDYKSLIAYAILLLFLFVKPTGITNEKAIQDV